jgi:hypothetical protein
MLQFHRRVKAPSYGDKPCGDDRALATRDWWAIVNGSD